MTTGLSIRAVKVSAEAIANAVQKDSHRCMIADAIRAQFPWAAYVMADTQSVRFSSLKTGRRYIYLTPPAGQRALIAFDQGKRVRPFTLTLNQGHSRQMRVRAPGYIPKRRNRKREKREPHRVMPTRFREYGLRQLEAQ